MTAAASPIRVGILGTGTMARTMAVVIAQAPGMTVVAVGSGAQSRADACAGAMGGVRAHGSRAALLADGDVDLVYIANATERHAIDAIAALEAGKSVLVEKPLATNSADAARVMEAAATANSFCMEAMWTPFLPAWARLEEAARSGEIGTPQHLTFSFGYPADPAAMPRLFNAGPGGGVLLDRGVYGAALALRIFGPATRVQAAIERSPAGADVAASLQLTHAGGAQSQIAVSLTALLPNAAALSCTGGMAELAPPALGSEAVIVHHAAFAGPGGGMVARLKRIPLLRRLKAARAGGAREAHSWGANMYLPMLAHVAAAVRNGRAESAAMPLSASLEVLKLLERARAGNQEAAPR